MGISYLLLSILFIAKRMLIAYSKKELDISLQNKFLESLLNISIQKKKIIQAEEFLTDIIGCLWLQKL